MGKPRSKLKSALAAAALVALAPLAALAQEGVVVINQQRLQFSAATVTMKVGQHLRFTNSDRVNHNVLISLGGVRTDSGLQKPGEPFEVPMLREGVYQVRCGIHPRMKMTVVVEK